MISIEYQKGPAKCNTLNSFCAGSDETHFVYPPNALADSEHHKQPSPRSPMVHRSTQTEGTPSSSQMQSSLLCPSGPPLTPCPSPVPQRKRVCANKTSNTLNFAEDNKAGYEALEKVISVLGVFSFRMVYCICYVPVHVLHIS